MKKTLSICLCIIFALALTFVFLPATLETPVSAATSGYTGDCTWTLDNGVLTISGNGAMGNCFFSPWGTSITKVVIEDGVTSIGDYAFDGCTALTSVTIGNSVASIGAYAFRSCTALTSVTIGNSVTSIGNYAFRGCTGMTSVTIGTGITSIGEYAFFNCSSQNAIHISDLKAWCEISFSNESANPLGYAKNLYLNGEKITNLVIPEGTTKIGKYAFYSCDFLTSIAIPDSVTSIGGYAFGGCTPLTSVTIGNGVTSIGAFSFYRCSNLKTVYYSGSRKEWNQIYHNAEIPVGATLYYHGCTETTHQYSSDCDTICNNCLTTRNNVWSNHQFEGNSVICKNCNAHRYFSYEANSQDGFTITDCESSRSGAIVIPSTIEGVPVTSIGWGSFSSCYNLTSITIPNSVTNIESSAFSHCWSLTSITIPVSVTNIGVSAFFYCSSLTSINIPNSVTSIGDRAFEGCTKLTSIAIPSEVKTISSYAFQSCTSLKEICFSKNVTTLEANAFNGCTELRDIWYGGTTADRNSITRESGNDSILAATWHFNTCAPDAHVYQDEKDTTCENCEWTRTLPYTPGDLDGVEGVSVDDAIYLLFHINFPSSYPVNQPVDFDGNGKEDMDDAIYLLFHVNFPASYPLH